jgi:hypothetical protein
LIGEGGYQNVNNVNKEDEQNDAEPNAGKRTT